MLLFLELSAHSISRGILRRNACILASARAPVTRFFNIVFRTGFPVVWGDLAFSTLRGFSSTPTFLCGIPYILHRISYFVCIPNILSPFEKSVILLMTFFFSSKSAQNPSHRAKQHGRSSSSKCRSSAVCLHLWSALCCSLWAKWDS